MSYFSKPRLVPDPRECSCGDHYFLSLTKGYMTIFDSSDVELAKSGCWLAMPTKRSVYAARFQTVGKGKRELVSFHRSAISASAGLDVDHIDGDSLNNKRDNLRPATRSQNARNSRSSKGSSSQFKGVSWNKRQRKWVSRIMVRGKTINLGTFDNERDAGRAYDIAAERFHSSFARPNSSSAVGKTGSPSPPHFMSVE
jgi:hypothetical protein